MSLSSAMFMHVKSVRTALQKCIAAAAVPQTLTTQQVHLQELMIWAVSFIKSV